MKGLAFTETEGPRRWGNDELEFVIKRGKITNVAQLFKG